MIKKISTCLFIGMIAVTGATASAAPLGSDSTEVFSAQPLFLKIKRDTLPVPATQPSVFENVYHQRLTSIQKEIPLPYNEVVQSFINIYLGRKEQMGRMIGLSEYYFPIFEKAFRSKGVPEEVKFLAIVESALDPQAVSRVGATGPWQFMYSSGKAFGLTIDDYQDERMDPIAASYAAANYFRDAYNEFGDWLLALAAYNCGKGNVNRAIRLAGGVNDFWAIREYLPKETRNYVPAFIATTYVMHYYNDHSISRRVSDLPLSTDTVAVNKYVSLANVSKAAGLDMNELVDLNPSYKKQIVNGSPESPKRLIIPQLDRNTFHSLYNALNLIKEDPAIKTVQAGDSGKRSGDKSYITYKVQPGDTLSTISEKFQGSSPVEIRDANGLRDEELKPGMLLKISQG